MKDKARSRSVSIPASVFGWVRRNISMVHRSLFLHQKERAEREERLLDEAFL